MVKTIYIFIFIIIGLITLVILDSKTKAFEKLSKKIKDFFDVRKYRKIANKNENDANTERKERIVALETVQTLIIEKMESDKQIIKLKAEIKELKRVIAEDMVKRQRKKKNDKKI